MDVNPETTLEKVEGMTKYPWPDPFWTPKCTLRVTEDLTTWRRPPLTTRDEATEGVGVETDGRRPGPVGTPEVTDPDPPGPRDETTGLSDRGDVAIRTSVQP